MRYTNEQELPWPVLSAIENHRYSKGSADYSVTELLNPPRVRELKRRHYDEIEVDAADMVFALFGTVVHFILQLSIQHIDPGLSTIQPGGCLCQIQLERLYLLTGYVTGSLDIDDSLLEIRKAFLIPRLNVLQLVLYTLKLQLK